MHASLCDAERVSPGFSAGFSAGFRWRCGPVLGLRPFKMALRQSKTSASGVSPSLIRQTQQQLSRDRSRTNAGNDSEAGVNKQQ